MKSSFLKFELISFSCFLFLFIFSCHKKDSTTPPIIPTLSIDSGFVSIKPTAGSKDSFSILSNSSWTISGVPTWASASPMSGSGNQKIILTGSVANSTLNTLSSTITVTGPSGSNLQKMIRLNQEAASPTLSTDSNSLTLSPILGSKDSFSILSNTSWTITGIPGWASAIPASGTGNQKIIIQTSSSNISSNVYLSTLSIISAQGSNLATNTVSMNQAAPDPQIISFSPLHAQGGNTLTLTGIGFSTIGLTSNTIKINGQTAVVNSLSSAPDLTTIQVTIPSLCGTGRLNVQVGNKTGVSSTSFTYDTVWNVSTFAGSGIAGYANGNGTNAQFNLPYGICLDGTGNLFIADFVNNCVRKIDPSGFVSTLAGSTTAGNLNGTGAAAQFRNPIAIATDLNGNVYVSDYGNNSIRFISPTGAVSTLAGTGIAGYANGSNSLAQFRNPAGISVDVSDGTVYVADYGNNVIRQISGGSVYTFSGSGTIGSIDGGSQSAQFNGPYGMAKDPSFHGTIHVTDYSGQLIRKIDYMGNVITQAGSTVGFLDGAATTAKFNGPTGASTTDINQSIFITDYWNNRIRKISANGEVSTIAGSSGAFADGTGTSAKFYRPNGLVIDRNGIIYVADTYNHRIRKITPQ